MAINSSGSAERTKATLVDGTGLELTKVDDAAFTPATSIVLPVGFLADDTSPDSVDEGDTGAARMGLDRVIYVQGQVAHDAVDLGSPIKIGFVARSAIPTAVTAADRVNALSDRVGRAQVSLGEFDDTGTGVKYEGSGSDATSNTSLGLLRASSFLKLYAPDGAWDRGASAGDSGPGLGALKVATIGGDITLRASATATVSGTSTAVDNLGWVKSFQCVLDVTGAAAGVTTLDVYVQTQMAEGTWQDIMHFPQVTTGAVKHLASWEGIESYPPRLGAEGAETITSDRYFTNEDAGLAASAVRLLPLGDSMRVKFVYVGDGAAYTFAVTISAH